MGLRPGRILDMARRRRVIRHRKGPKKTPILDMFNPKLRDMREVTEEIADRLARTAQRDLWPSSKIRAKGLKKAASITRRMRAHKETYPNPRRFHLHPDDIDWARERVEEWMMEP